MAMFTTFRSNLNELVRHSLLNCSSMFAGSIVVSFIYDDESGNPSVDGKFILSLGVAPLVLGAMPEAKESEVYSKEGVVSSRSI